MGDPHDAKTSFLEAIDRNPSHAGAHVNYGRLVQHESPTTAIAHYRHALEADPSHATAAFNLGTALELTGQVADAIFGENAQPTGTIVFDDQQVSFNNNGLEIEITILNFSTGEVTNITVPTLTQ